MKLSSTFLVCGALAAGLVTAVAPASAMPVAPGTGSLAASTPSVAPEKVFIRCYRFGRCVRYGGYRRIYRPYYYGYRRPVIGIRVPFVRFGIY